MKVLALIIALVLCHTVEAKIAPTKNPYIFNGKIVAAGTWLSRGMVKVGESCSGTLVAPQIVVTAGHCLKSPEAVVITSHQDQQTVAEAFEIHPLWRGNADFIANDVGDIAVIKLRSEIKDTTPIPLLPDHFVLQKGLSLVIAGYGISARPGCMYCSGDFGTLRELDKTLNDFPHHYIFSTKNQTSGALNGDSGGGAFVEIAGTNYLAGVISFGVNDFDTATDSPDEFDTFSSIQTYRPWLIQTISKLMNLKFKPRAVTDVVSATQLPNGDFSVKCVNGITEVVSVQEMANGKVCQTTKGVTYKNVHRYADGALAIECSNGSSENVTLNDFLRGRVCLPSPAKTAVQIASGGYHYCALTSDQEILCWGQNTAYQMEVPAGVKFQKVIASSEYSCGLSVEGHLHCWGATPIPDPWLKGETVLDVAGARDAACAITTKGLVCESSYLRQEDLLAPPALNRPTRIWGGERANFCADTADGLICWTLSKSSPKVFPQAPTTFSGRVSGVKFSYMNTCVTHEDPGFINNHHRVQCWGDPQTAFDESIPVIEFFPDSPSQHYYTSVGKFYLQTAAKFSDYAKYTPPTFLGGVSKVAETYASFCAIASEGVRCWGYPDAAEVQVPKELGHN